MDSSMSLPSSCITPDNLALVRYVPPKVPPTKSDNCKVALAIIASIGGLAVAGGGLAACYQLGSLSTFSMYGFAIGIGVSGGGLVISIQEYYRVSSPKHQPKPLKIKMPNRLDPIVSENAYRILAIHPDKTKDQDYITDRYALLLTSLESRQRRLSPVLADALQTMIDDVNAAYRTLSVDWVSKGIGN